VSSTVAVTLVFTDLLGSTAIGARLPPEATERRQAQFVVRREAIAATAGTDVKTRLGRSHCPRRRNARWRSAGATAPPSWPNDSDRMGRT